VNLLFGLYNDPTEWVWTYVGIAAAHGMFAADGAGQSLGLDRVLRLKPILPAGSPVGQIYALAS
jgi:hypothetical protein